MKQIINKNEVLNKIEHSVENFSNLVLSTMGPFGRNVALHNEVGKPVITKDGVSVAKVINFEDPSENLIAEILRQAAEKTNDEAGDGTTTSTAIASSLFKAGKETILKKNINVNLLRKEISDFQKVMKKYLEDNKVFFKDRPDEEVKSILNKIALISTNGDEELSNVISSAVYLAGNEGIVNVKNSGFSYDLTRSEGMKLPNSSVMDLNFLRGSVEKRALLKKCRILITTHELEDANIINVLQPRIFNQIKEKNESILIITQKAGKGFLANMVNNNAKGSLQNIIVKSPYFGAVGRDMMDDIAAITGGTVIDQAAGHNLANVSIEHLGYAEEVEVSTKETILFRPKKDPKRLQERIEELQKKAKQINYKRNDLDKTMERLAALTGAVYTVNIPSFSDIEDKERRDRVEDAIQSCLGALEHGYLPGGGSTLLRAINLLKDQNYSEDTKKILQKVLEFPFLMIAENAGLTEDISDKLSNIINTPNMVYDFRNQKNGDALELGIIDSYKVASESFFNGLSVGIMLLTTNGIIADIPQRASPFEFDPGMF